MRGPMRSMAWGGLGFGITVLVVGILFLLINQRVIVVSNFDFWTVCSIFLIVFGLVVIGGVLWARRMMAGGWRRWAEGWDEGWRREPPMPPSP